MFIHRWLSHRIEKIADSMMNATEEAFDAAVERINALAEMVSRWMSWAPDVDRSPMEIGLHALADAAGEDTRTSVELDASLTDHGAVSVGVGRAAAFAAAEAGSLNPSEIAVAEADSAIDGADFVLTFDRTSTGDNHQSATHAFIAIDLAFYDAGAARTIAVCMDEEDDEYIDIGHGNTAESAFEVAVRGEDSVVDVVVDVLAVEDRFSSSSVEAFLAIG